MYVRYFEHLVTEKHLKFGRFFLEMLFRSCSYVCLYFTSQYTSRSSFYPQRKYFQGHYLTQVFGSLDFFVEARIKNHRHGENFWG